MKPWKNTLDAQVALFLACREREEKSRSIQKSKKLNGFVFDVP
jgi:hypothetical protein